MMRESECVECGGSPIPHAVTYVTVLLDMIAEPLFAPGPVLRFLGKQLYRATGRLSPRVMQWCAALRIARTIDTPDERTALLARMLWEEADTRGIRVTEWRLFNLPRNMFIARFPDGRTISYEGIPMPDNGIDRVWWMDNKSELKKRFQKLNLPVARGGAYFTYQGALRAFTKLQTTVIVKPHSGSASRHTTLHIHTPEELQRAFSVARAVSPLAVVEEELRGPVYRATVVAGKFAALLRRDPPLVIGDGVRTVRELVAVANEHPKRGGPYFSKIKLNAAAESELAWQNLSLDAIPEEGRRVALSTRK
jgi:hypothetical protein